MTFKTLASIALLALIPHVVSAAPLPASGLAGAFIAAGGGAGSFSTVRALSSMVGGAAVQTELSAMQARSNPQARDQFVQIFDFAVSDAWTRAGEDNVSFPDSAQRGMDLAKALYSAGIEGSKFSGEAFFANLFTEHVWADVSRDIDAKFGPGTSATFADNVGVMFGDLQPQLQS